MTCRRRSPSLSFFLVNPSATTGSLCSAPRYHLYLLSLTFRPPNASEAISPSSETGCSSHQERGARAVLRDLASGQSVQSVKSVSMQPGNGRHGCVETTGPHQSVGKQAHDLSGFAETLGNLKDAKFLIFDPGRRPCAFLLPRCGRESTTWCVCVKRGLTWWSWVEHVCCTLVSFVTCRHG